MATSFEGCDIAQSGSGMGSRVMDGSMQPVFVQRQGEGPKSAWAAWLGCGWFAWMIRGGRLLSVPWTSQLSSLPVQSSLVGPSTVAAIAGLSDRAAERSSAQARLGNNRRARCHLGPVGDKVPRRARPEKRYLPARSGSRIKRIRRVT